MTPNKMPYESSDIHGVKDYSTYTNTTFRVIREGRLRLLLFFNLNISGLQSMRVDDIDQSANVVDGCVGWVWKGSGSTSRPITMRLYMNSSQLIASASSVQTDGTLKDIVDSDGTCFGSIVYYH